ncbi:hypothetical protein SAMN05421788_104351 [Filimonas lacunae]|uniref:Type IX secretion system protein PorV domain-containing protein n=1 Tax=Filimonas lacunae TaxID=477680 RepID=A0A173MS61_9BACT|nr:type IX secretion system outer membrane channel protein PorV [Filimonas lacunae]BAV10279.1 hypothetical protein FLA_6340 [Filimonas lacunae]SIT17542.1 hypothetical protein SAMN05421788_104351 [Filimonas lacunae]
MKLIAFGAKSLLLIMVLSGSILVASAQSINVVTSAVPFLRISPDARAGGMGDVGIATLPDANSSFWNQAKIPFATQKSAIGVTYTPWLSDITSDVYLATLAGYHQLDEEQAITASLRYFNMGNIQFTNINNEPLGQSTPRELAFDLGYTRKLTSKLSVGVQLRYINSKLVTGPVGNVNYKPGNAFAADLSVFHNGLDDKGQGFTWGVTLSNLGTRISYTDNAANKDYIPANMGVGGAYTFALDEDSKLTFGADLNKLLVPAMPVGASTDEQKEYYNRNVFESWFKSFGGANGGLKTVQVSTGAEFAYMNQFFARAGYFFEDKSQGGRKYITMGVGFRYNIVGANFSYLIPSGSGVTRNPLSNTLRFGLSFDLSGSKD